MGYNAAAFPVSPWLVVVGGLLLITAAFGLYRLREDDGLMRLSAVAVAVGALFMVGAEVAFIGMAYELTSGAVETTRVPSSTLGVISHVTSHAVIGAALVAFAVGRLLALGIGVGFAAVAILRTRTTWMWVGWLGVVAAVPGGLYPTVVHGWTSIPSFIGYGFSIAWLTAVGVVLLRLPQRGPAATT